jgi:hypothetical protein
MSEVAMPRSERAGLLSREYRRCTVCRQADESAWTGVCSWCLEARPRQAALALRRRAEQVRRLAERCRPCLGAWGWTGLHRLLYEQAAALEDVAEGLVRLAVW